MEGIKMAQRNEMVEKKRVKWDGVEVDGLMKVGEISMEKMTAEAPTFKKIKMVNADITKYPPIELVYLVKKDGSVLKFLEDFYNNDQVKDMIIMRTDAAGNDFPGSKKLYSSCECIKKTTPAFDAASPVIAQMTITVIYDEEIQL